MWKIKHFKTLKAFEKWIETEGHKYQWEQLFVNNKEYSVEYRRLTLIYITD